jgi:hypothetical protein
VLPVQVGTAQAVPDGGQSLGTTQPTQCPAPSQIVPPWSQGAPTDTFVVAQHPAVQMGSTHWEGPMRQPATVTHAGAPAQPASMPPVPVVPPVLVVPPVQVVPPVPAVPPVPVGPPPVPEAAALDEVAPDDVLARPPDPDAPTLVTVPLQPSAIRMAYATPPTAEPACRSPMTMSPWGERRASEQRGHGRTRRGPAAVPLGARHGVQGAALAPTTGICRSLRKVSCWLGGS